MDFLLWESAMYWRYGVYGMCDDCIYFKISEDGEPYCDNPESVYFGAYVDENDTCGAIVETWGDPY